MKNLISIDPIAVKDKHEVVKALTILERLGIKIMTDDAKEKYLADDTNLVDNNFLIQDQDGTFRIQTHFIKFGISIKNLEKQVDDIIEKYSTNFSEITGCQDEKKTYPLIKITENGTISDENIIYIVSEEHPSNMQNYQIFKVKDLVLERMGSYEGRNGADAINRMAKHGVLRGNEWAMKYIAIPDGSHFRQFTPEVD